MIMKEVPIFAYVQDDSMYYTSYNSSRVFEWKIFEGKANYVFSLPGKNASYRAIVKVGDKLAYGPFWGKRIIIHDLKTTEITCIDIDSDEDLQIISAGTCDENVYFAGLSQYLYKVDLRTSKAEKILLDNDKDASCKGSIIYINEKIYIASRVKGLFYTCNKNGDDISTLTIEGIDTGFDDALRVDDKILALPRDDEYAYFIADDGKVLERFKTYMKTNTFCKLYLGDKYIVCSDWFNGKTLVCDKHSYEIVGSYDLCESSIKRPGIRFVQLIENKILFYRYDDFEPWELDIETGTIKRKEVHIANSDVYLNDAVALKLIVSECDISLQSFINYIESADR